MQTHHALCIMQVGNVILVYMIQQHIDYSKVNIMELHKIDNTNP